MESKPAFSAAWASRAILSGELLKPEFIDASPNLSWFAMSIF
jgi:hypothetical protein